MAKNVKLPQLSTEILEALAETLHIDKQLEVLPTPGTIRDIQERLVEVEENLTLLLDYLKLADQSITEK